MTGGLSQSLARAPVALPDADAVRSIATVDLTSDEIAEYGEAIKWRSAAQMRELSDDDLRRYDDLLSRGGGAPGRVVAPLGFYRDELNRRAQERTTAALVGLTRWLVGLTVAIVLLTLVIAALTWRLDQRESGSPPQMVQSL
jgi:hypothetical protein